MMDDQTLQDIRERHHDWFHDPRGSQTIIEVVHDREALLDDVDRLREDYDLCERDNDDLRQVIGNYQREVEGLQARFHEYHHLLWQFVDAHQIPAARKDGTDRLLLDIDPALLAEAAEAVGYDEQGQ